MFPSPPAVNKYYATMTVGGVADINVGKRNKEAKNPPLGAEEGISFFNNIQKQIRDH